MCLSKSPQSRHTVEKGGGFWLGVDLGNMLNSLETGLRNLTLCDLGKIT